MKWKRLSTLQNNAVNKWFWFELNELIVANGWLHTKWNQTIHPFIPFCIFPTALCHMCFDYVLHWPHYINSNYRFLLIPCDWDRPNPHIRKSNLFLPNKDMIPFAWYFKTRKKNRIGSNIDSFQFFGEVFFLCVRFLTFLFAIW